MRDPAAEIAATGTTVDVGDATTRHPLHGLLPSWFVPGEDGRRQRPRGQAAGRRPLSPGCLAGVGAAVGACVLLPCGEELLRCVRTARARKKLSRKGR